jgi:hypothetical protein
MSAIDYLMIGSATERFRAGFGRSPEYYGPDYPRIGLRTD